MYFSIIKNYNDTYVSIGGYDICQAENSNGTSDGQTSSS